MGCRGQILIKDTGVYLYTHWTAKELIKTVNRVFIKNFGVNGYDEPTQLAKEIFCEMMRGNEDDIGGFGIDTQEYSNNECFITLDCKNKTILIKDHDINQKMSFRHFMLLVSGNTLKTQKFLEENIVNKCAEEIIDHFENEWLVRKMKVNT